MTARRGGAAAFQSRVGDRLRDLADAREIASVAVEMVGERLGVARVVYAVVDEGDAGTATVEAGWTDGGLPPLSGSHPLAALGIRPGERGAGIHRVDDAAAGQVPATGRAAMEGSVVAALAVPLMRGGTLCAVIAAHDAAPRRWKDADVALLRDVGERVWAETERARAQAALRASETRHRMIVEGARDYAIYTADENGRIESWPPGAQAVFGWTAEEAVGQPFEITFVPEDRERGAPAEELAVARAQGTAGDVRWHLRKDGSRVFIEGTTRALRGGDGAPSFLKIGQDVTLRRAAEAALRESEARQRFLLAVGDRLRELDDPRQVAYAAAEMLGRHLQVDRAVYAQVEPDGEHASVWAEWAGGALPPAADRYRMDDYGVGEAYRQGRIHWLYDAHAERDVRPGAAALAAVGVRAAVGAPILKGGRLSAVLAAHHALPREWSDAEVELVRDVGERVWAEAERARAQAALRESEARHRMIVEGAVGYAIFTADDGRRIESWPPGAQSVFGWTAEEAVGQPVDMLFVAEDRARAVPEREFATARARGVAPDVRWHLRKDGSRVFIEGSVRAMRDAAGALRFVKMGQDVTRRRQAEKALRESEARFRLLFDSMDEGFCILEVLFDAAGQAADYRFLEVNPAFERYTGLAGAAGKTMRELAPAHEAHWFETYGRVALTGEPARFEARAAALEGRWYDVYAFRVGEPAQRRVAVLFNDVTERRKADDALQAARQSLEVALDAARLGAWDADLVAGTARTSPRHDEIMGDAAPVSRWNPQAFRARLLPDDRPVFDAALARAMDAVAQGEMETEVRVRWSGGGARWVRLVGRVYRDDGGRPARMAGVSLDVTAQKEADAALERAHAWLEQRVAERTAELAIANEVLATQIAEREALERARDQLLRQLARAEEQERLRLSRELHDQMGQLVAALLLGLRSLEVGPGPAPGALGELERLAEQIAREVHTVALELRPPALDRLGLRRALEGRLGEWAERHRLEADFQAVGIGDERFQPEIETALFRAVQEGLTNVARHARATGVSLVLERRPGSIAVILEDDGRGFDVEAASGAAAEGGEGGRLGLLGMQERVRLLGGTLDIESTPGAGTTLYVRLPDRAVAGPGAGVEA